MAQEIGALSIEARAEYSGQLDTERELPVWHKDHPSNPPAGSTEESLLVLERGRPVRVAGPTHYHHLADGRVVGGYSGGTHYDDGTKVVRIVGSHEG